jgi:hypothetical protein
MARTFRTDWIEARLRELGKPKNGLAKAIGQGEARVTGIINGSRQIKSRELPAISHYLEMPLTEIMKRLCGDPGYLLSDTRSNFSGHGDQTKDMGRRVYEATKEVLEVFVENKLQGMSREEVDIYATVISRCASKPQLIDRRGRAKNIEDTVTYLQDYLKLTGRI